MRLEDVLKRLKGVRKYEDYWMAHCPAHPDNNQSLSIRRRGATGASLKCFAGCSRDQILNALRATTPEPVPGGHARTQDGDATVQRVSAGLTLAAYAEAKGIPESFLEQCGLLQITYNRRPAVRISYRDQNGDEVAIRFRIGLTGEHRFRWKPGNKPCLYGLWRLAEAIKAGYVVLVEGESDFHTLAFHGIPSLGIPGVSNWRDEWAEHLAPIGVVYAVLEPDQGGANLLKALARSPLRDRLHIIELNRAKDPSELYLRDRQGFPEAMKHAITSAVPLAEEIERERIRAAAEDRKTCESLLKNRNILGAFAEHLHRHDVIGEDRALKLIYLALTSRLLEQPVSLVLQASSSAGKSYVLAMTAKRFPPDSYYEFTGMSSRALLYGSEDLSHRFLIVYEMDGLIDPFLDYCIRTLLSEGRLSYGTVDSTNSGPKYRYLHREGPTGVIITTTKEDIHPENATRKIRVPMNETPEQTKAVMRHQARRRQAGRKSGADDPTPWIALQRYLGHMPTEVIVPFAGALAELMDPSVLRLRRDIGKVLDLVRAHALLHQESRPRDGGLVVATVDDYEAVHGLVHDLLAFEARESVPVATRMTVAAVGSLLQKMPTVSLTDLARVLKLSPSAASRRTKKCLDLGYLRNDEIRAGVPMKLVLGHPFPDDGPVLPQPGDLRHHCAVASPPPGADPPPRPPMRCSIARRHERRGRRENPNG